MNENDSSDLVSKTKKSGGSKTKRTRAKRATKATASKKISTTVQGNGLISPRRYREKGSIFRPKNRKFLVFP